ncbi:MAG TPA: hypothetical protein VEA78_03845, partial [Acidimicrobiales bacterium]|nr:hypothetical protein [Acidimicrobiales bacterium]
STDKWYRLIARSGLRSTRSLRALGRLALAMVPVQRAIDPKRRDSARRLSSAAMLLAGVASTGDRSVFGRIVGR